MSLPFRFVPGMVFIFSSLLIFVTEPATAAGPELGIRAAITIEHEEEELHLYEVFYAQRLPWGKRFDNDWRFETALDVSLGLLEGGGDDGTRGALGVDFRFLPPDSSIKLSTGLGAGYMSREEYGEEDLAGPVFFRFHGGVSYHFLRWWSIGYRFHHESNGALYDKNPSLNMHQLELRMIF